LEKKKTLTGFQVHEAKKEEIKKKGGLRKATGKKKKGKFFR